jgi:hypothetical protein
VFRFSCPGEDYCCGPSPIGVTRITRRTFRRHRGAIAACGLWWSLTDQAGIADTWAAADLLQAPEPNPKSGGILRYGMPSTPAHFDLHQSGTVNNLGTQGCMYDNLIRHDPRDGVRRSSDLAHSWEISRDGKHIRSSCGRVKFHDGAEFRRGRQSHIFQDRVAAAGMVSPARRCSQR